MAIDQCMLQLIAGRDLCRYQLRGVATVKMVVEGEVRLQFLQHIHAELEETVEDLTNISEVFP